MNRYKRYLPIVAALLVAAGVSLDQYGIDLASLARGGGATSAPRDTDAPLARERGSADAASHPDYAQWSDTSPNINLWHVFEGEINRSGKPVGYHSRPDGRDPANARVVSIGNEPNRLGVYTARVEIRDGDRWKDKNSSFFPDSLSRGDVVDAVPERVPREPEPGRATVRGPVGARFSHPGLHVEPRRHQHRVPDLRPEPLKGLPRRPSGMLVARAGG